MDLSNRFWRAWRRTREALQLASSLGLSGFGFNLRRLHRRSFSRRNRQRARVTASGFAKFGSFKFANDALRDLAAGNSSRGATADERLGQPAKRCRTRQLDRTDRDSASSRHR